MHQTSLVSLQVSNQQFQYEEEDVDLVMESLVKALGKTVFLNFIFMISQRSKYFRLYTKIMVWLFIMNILHYSGCDANVGTDGNLTQSLSLPDLPPSISVKLTGLGGNAGIGTLPHNIWAKLQCIRVGSVKL